MTPIGAIPRPPPEYRDRISGLHRCIGSPANPVEHARRIAFKFPALHGAVLALDVHEEVNVWIGPLHLRDNSRQRDGLGAVVLGAKGVMRPGRRRHGETGEYKNRWFQHAGSLKG